MNKDFEEFIKNFRPEFGNEKHIQALEMITRIRTKESLIKQKLSNQKAIQTKLVEIKRNEQAVMFLLKSK